MMRRLGLAAVATGLAGALANPAPAQAVELCDPNRFVCVYVLDGRNGCPGGYDQILRVPNVATGGVVLLVCALQ